VPGVTCAHSSARNQQRPTDHRPDEYASPQAIANGALVLAKALAEALAELSAK
jgi:hypothetical protein